MEKYLKSVRCHKGSGSFHCMKSVQIRSFLWAAFSRIRTEYEPEKTLYLDTFHAVLAPGVH